MFLTNLDQRLWDPMEAIRRIRDEMDRLGDDRAAPAVNLWTKEDEALLTAEIPGVDPQDLDIAVEGNTVTLKGVRKWDEPKEEDTVHRVETFNGEFSRTVDLPFRVKQDGVQARYVRGVLNVSLPRAEEDRPKKIQVKSA
jgi:HSP20 family protein